MAARLWVGGLEVGISERDLEDEVTSPASLRRPRRHDLFDTVFVLQFGRYGKLRSVWVARKVTNPRLGSLLRSCSCDVRSAALTALCL